MDNFFLRDVSPDSSALSCSACSSAPRAICSASPPTSGDFARGPRPLARPASLVLAIAVVPGSVFLVARFTSLTVATALLVLVAAAGAVVAARSRAGIHPRRALADPLTRRALLVAGVWIALTLLLLSDLQLGRSLYPNVVAYDYAKHISVTDAVRRTGVPPLNPSLRLGTASCCTTTTSGSSSAASPT
jgi:hypothetical protein